MLYIFFNKNYKMKVYKCIKYCVSDGSTNISLQIPECRFLKYTPY